MTAPNKLAIVDWGIGGIGIRKLIAQRFRGLGVTYFSDTGVTPYGRMSRRELVNRLDTVIGYLADLGITHVIVGCNAASTVIPFLSDHTLLIKGVIESAVLKTVRLSPARLGLIGGRRTVMSGVYRREFSDRGIDVAQRVAQPLSAMIESGDVASAELRTACERILRPLRNHTHILLACTHYPAITRMLREAVSDATLFIDPANALVESLAQWDLPNDGKDVYLTTGDPKLMRSAARLAFDWQIKSAECGVGSER